MYCFINLFQVPELAGFWLLTLLLQFPLSLFLLLNEATLITPFERAMHIVFTCFVLFEVIVGYFAIRAMVDYQVTKFHLQQFTDMEHIQDVQFENYTYENRYTQ
jgi:transmembrane protein 17